MCPELMRLNCIRQASMDTSVNLSTSAREKHVLQRLSLVSTRFCFAMG